MTETLRKTLGFDFDIDKFGSDDESEVAGPGGQYRSSSAAVPVPRAAAHQPPSPTEDEDRFDSMGDSADLVLAQYMEMARTPPRTTRREKEKKSYRHQAQAANKTLKASLRRRSSMDNKFMSLPAFAEDDTEGSSIDVPDSAKPASSRRRERVLHRERRAERLHKQRQSGELTLVVGGAGHHDDADDDRCTSLKVESSSCFHSLSSKPVSQSPSPSPRRRRHHRSRALSGDVSPQSPQSPLADGPQSERADFHHRFTALVRLGSSQHPDTRKRSREELRYQTELQDVLWLALHAYHAGETMQQADRALCTRRAQLPALVHAVLQFRFEPDASAAAAAAGGACPAGGGGRCVNVWCRACLDGQQQALQRVAEVIARMDEAEQLYPSGRRLRQHQPAFREHEFRRRLKTLYLWHNLTTQLWLRCRIIRQYLKGMGAGHLPWPELEAAQDVAARADCPPTPASASISMPATPATDQPPPYRSGPRVHFTSLESVSSACASGPSDSVGSSASEGGITLLTVRERKRTPSAESQDAETPRAPAPQRPAGTSSGDSALGSSAASNNGQVQAPPRAPQPYHWSVSSASATSEADTEADDKTPYRKCVEKLLKTRGLKRTLAKLSFHLKGVLDQAHMSLLPPDSQRSSSPTAEVCSSGGEAASFGLDERTAQELREYGELSAASRDMNLPSLKPVYTWLTLVPLELTHECVRIRLQQQPQEPSSLSIRQLISECKEALRASVVVRQRFVRRRRALRCVAAGAAAAASVTCADAAAGPGRADKLDTVLENFDSDVRQMLEVYLRYIKRLLLLMQWEIEVSVAQKSLLEQEWSFAKSVCPHIAGGEAVAGRNFCFLVSDILPTIGDLLENGIDQCVASLQRSASVPGSGHELHANRQATLSTLRELRGLFQEARDRALKVLLFARLLRQELEIAAAFNLLSDAETLLNRLADTGHVRVIAPHSHQHVIFIPGALQADRAQVWRLLDMSVSRAEPPVVGPPGYLVLLDSQACGDVEALWRGTTIRLEPTAEATISLSYVEVHGLLLVVNDAGHLSHVRQPLLTALSPCVQLRREVTPPNRAITDALEELKEEALKLRAVVAGSVALVEEKCSAMLADQRPGSLAARCREVLHQCFQFAFEYHREMVRLITGERRAELAPALLDLARHWLRYALEHCPAGQGLRPRWAREGLEFVGLALEPQYTVHLERDDFQSLQEQVTGLIRHLQTPAVLSSPLLALDSSRPGSPVLGELSRPPYRTSRSLPGPGEPTRPGRRPSSASVSAAGGAETATPPTGRRSLAGRLDALRQDSSDADGGLSDSASVSPLGSRAAGLERELPVSLSSPGRLSLDGLHTVTPLERARLAVVALDARRDDRLLQLRRIGHVSERPSADRVHIKAKTVNFTWQMGILIGQGRFGRVYTAVNNSTGDLMAVKEMQLQRDDHRALRAAAEELQLLEGVHHPHLVRYYGVEIHREEMFIFMEFCGEGTLESLSASVDGGLPEHLIRHYTKQLLSAVACLHAHHIVHRDIKGANIFLTDECRCLKLGDFGCSVKIVAHTTMQGEVKGLVGTPAFMAPEVYTRSAGEGQGRAADVWSLGCCVVEMATGKRPFPELEDTYQIMFRVGMGGSPAVPEKLSEEGQQFLELCFQHEARLRAPAVQLIDHPFVKVEADADECLSSLPQSLMPGFGRPGAF